MRFAGLMGRAMMSIDFYIMLKLQEISLFAQIKALITVHHDWQFAFETYMDQTFSNRCIAKCSSFSNSKPIVSFVISVCVWVWIEIEKWWKEKI